MYFDLVVLSRVRNKKYNLGVLRSNKSIICRD